MLLSRLVLDRRDEGGRRDRCSAGGAGRAAAAIALVLLLTPVASAEGRERPIHPGNEPPVAFGAELYTTEGTALRVTLDAEDSDGPGPYRVLVLDGPSGGELQRVEGGRFDYLPQPGVTGWDTFTWAVDDGADLSASATVDILVNGLPIASPQSASIGVDEVLALELDAVDDGWPEPPGFFVSEPPVNGSLVEDPPGVFQYRPDPGFAGEDGFDWYFTDGVEVSETVHYDIVVNDPPVALDQALLADFGVPLVLTLEGVDDGYPGDYTIELLSSPVGDLAEQAFGVYEYTPPSGWTGPDSFQWRISDGLEWSSPGTATVVVNDPPEAIPQWQATNVDVPLTGQLEWVDDGVPGPVEIQITTGPSNGDLVLGEEFGSFVYTPHAGFTGKDSFRWRVSDGSLWSDIVDFRLRVNAPPQALDQNVLTAPDVAVTIELRMEDDDFPGPYVYTLGEPAHGTLTEVGAGTYSYLPDAGFSGYDSCVWSVDDGMAPSGEATVTMVVNAPPVARDQIVFVTLDTPKTFALDAEDDGVPGPLSYTIMRDPFHGTLEELEPGLYTYTPVPGYVGTDDAKWSVTDGLESTPVAVASFGVQDEPQLLIRPERLTLHQYLGESKVSATVEVLNPGVAPLEWTSVDESFAFVVSSEPASAVVEPESALDIEVTIELGALGAGSYLGALSLRDPSGQSIYGVLELELGVREPDQDRYGPGEVGVEAWIPPDPRQTHARHLRFRPADGQVVSLDPPRFSWPYESRIIDPWGDYLADNLFTLEIASDPGFSQVVTRVDETPYNFYTFLPPLGAEGPWYWRVGYDIGTPEGTWSETRSFSVAPDALVWDRSDFGTQLAALGAHPRLFFDDATLPTLQTLKDVDPRAQELYVQMQDAIQAGKETTWWDDFPTDDCPEGTDPESPSCSYSYWSIGRVLTMAAFVHKVFGEESFDEIKQRFLLLASYPPGGWSSPEGLNPGTAFKDPDHLTQMLALFYDWFHDDLTGKELSTLLTSLDWRIDHVLHDFAWTREWPDGPIVDFDSLARIGWSHPYEAIMPAIIGSLGVYEDLPVAREAVELGLHFVVGVTASYGEDEGWNEGPGYGNDKFGRLLETLFAFDVALPGLEVWNIDSLPGYVDFFSRITPLAAEHSSFGNRGYRRYDWLSSRAQDMWLLAAGLGSEQAQANLDETTLLMTLNSRAIEPDFPWLFYTLPAYYADPDPVAETETDALFPLEGWVTVDSAPASDLTAQEDAVSMTFQSRPRGGYGHSFASDNAFDLHAYGRTVAVGGGTTDNDLQFPRESLSHNTVLVGGHGQVHDPFAYYDEGGLDEALRELAVPVRARVIAWEEGEVGGVPYVYWAGSAADSYPADAGLDSFVRHVVFVDQRWFVIYDDIRLLPGERSTFDWLYHVVPGESVPVTFDPAAFSFEYTLPIVPDSPPAEVSVLVRHLAGVADLSFLDLLGQDGQVNVRTCGLDPVPGTCAEDYRFEGAEGQEAVVDGHHIWVSSSTPSAGGRFLAAVVPWRPDSQSRPEILAVAGTERAVEVDFDGRRVTVSFDPSVPGDIRVDPDAVAFRDRVPVDGSAAGSGPRRHPRW